LKTTEKQILRILHLESSDFDAQLIIRELRHGGLNFVIQRVETEADFEKSLEEFKPDIILATTNSPPLMEERR